MPSFLPPSPSCAGSLTNFFGSLTPSVWLVSWVTWGSSFFMGSFLLAVELSDFGCPFSLAFPLLLSCPFPAGC